jgi:hypothetical protein
VRQFSVLSSRFSVLSSQFSVVGCRRNRDFCARRALCFGAERGSPRPLPRRAIRLSPGFQPLQKIVLVLVLVIDSLDCLASAIPPDAPLAAHAALRSPNKWRPKSRTSTSTSTIEEVETLNSTAPARDEKISQACLIFVPFSPGVYAGFLDLSHEALFPK